MHLRHWLFHIQCRKQSMLSKTLELKVLICLIAYYSLEIPSLSFFPSPSLHLSSSLPFLPPIPPSSPSLFFPLTLSYPLPLFLFPLFSSFILSPSLPPFLSIFSSHSLPPFLSPSNPSLCFFIKHITT